MKKPFFTLILLTVSYFSYSQSTDVIKKGASVFIQQISANDNIKDYTDFFSKELQDWGYWKVVPSKNHADVIIDLNLDSHKGITMTSFGGQSIIAYAKFHTTSGKKLLQTENYQSSPNGSNGFNAGKSAIKKLVRNLKKQFR